MEEPGVDEHVWRSRWEAIEPDLRAGQAEAPAEVDELVAELMRARGIPLAERGGDDTNEPETTRRFVEARRVRRQIDAGESYDPGDVADAVGAYRSLYVDLVGRGPAAGGPA